MKNKNFILFGGGGFIGTNFQKQFPENKYLVIDKRFKDTFSYSTYIKADLTKSFDKKKLIYFDKDEELNIMILAANLGIDKVLNTDNYLEEEIKLQENIYSLIRFLTNHYKKINIIYFSTSEIYGDAKLMKENGVSSLNLNESFYKRRRYATIKLFFEDRYLEFKDLYKTNLLIIRPFNVVGPYQDKNFVIPKMITEGKINQKITVFNGSQERSFIHVYDFNKYLSLLIENIKEINLNYYIFNIANLKNYVKIDFLAQLIQKFLNDYGYSCEIEREIKDKNIIGQTRRVPDITRLYEVTKYLPERDLKDIIKELIEYY